MPYTRPTLSALRDQAAADIDASLEGADARLRNSNLGVLGDMQAGFSHLHFGYIANIAKESTPFTAEERLTAWAALRGVIAKDALFASGLCAFAATAGSVLAAGSVMSRADGRSYVTTADASEVASTIVAPIKATISGADGNAPANVLLTLSTAHDGVQATGLSSGLITGGTDPEAPEALRSRMLQAYAAGAQGGGEADYVTWALRAPGVTRAWAKRAAMGAGTVVVWAMLDDARVANGGFPLGANGTAALEARAAHATGDLLDLANFLFGLQPANALVYVCALTPWPVAVSITGLTSDQLAACVPALQATFRELAGPGSAVRRDDLVAAIAQATLSRTFRLVAPTTDLTAPSGSLPTLGALTPA